MSSSQPILTLQGLKRSFRQGPKTVDVLRGVDVEVKAGELVALVGASGSGKSTLLQIAGLLDTATEGRLCIDGADVSGLKDEARSMIRQQKLGFVYQFHHLLPDFTALENVALALRIKGFTDRAAREEATTLLSDMGLADRLEHTPAKLSGGEQQRVAIARALAGNPVLLLADEPTGNLDEETARKVFDLFIAKVRDRGLAALIATHDRDLAARADRQLHLREGRLHEA